MRTMTEQEAREQFGAALEASRSGPVLIRKDQEDVAVLVSLRDFQRLRTIRADRFNALCDEVAARAAERGLTDEILEDLLRDVS